MKPTVPIYRNLSCQYITEAFFHLMQKEDYKDITISEITMGAGVARRTFYLNYSSKEDILDQHYETMIREYDEGFTQEMGEDIRKQAVYFFSFWHKHRDYAAMLDKNGLLYMLVNRFYGYLEHSRIEAIPIVSEIEQEYVFSFVAGGLFMMLRTWLRNGFHESPEQLADMYVRICAIQIGSDANGIFSVDS